MTMWSYYRGDKPVSEVGPQVDRLVTVVRRDGESMDEWVERWWDANRSIVLGPKPTPTF